MVIIIDTREQLPFKFGGKVEIVRKGLPTGDYSIVGLEEHVAIERKSLNDLVNCCATGRERFMNEVLRLRGYPTRAIICEGSWAQINGGEYVSRIKKNSVIGTIVRWQQMGVPVTMANTRLWAERLTFAQLRLAYNTAQFQLKNLTPGKKIQMNESFA